MKTIKDLKKNDLVYGPSTDRGYWLIAFSEKLASTSLYKPFINIGWGKENVLQKTINNLYSMDLKYTLLNKKTDLDTILDIENRT